MEKECAITDNAELNKLKSIISDMYLEGCEDAPDLHKIKALSGTLLSTLNNADRFILTSKDPEIVLNALHDSISSQLHHAISQEIKDTNNFKDITFKGDEILWRGINLPSHVDIEKFLSLTHLHAPMMYKFYLPASEEVTDYCVRVCTSAGFSIPLPYTQDSEGDGIGYLLEIRPKSGQVGTFLADYHRTFGLVELEIDFDKIDTYEVYAAYKIQVLWGADKSGYNSAYRIEQVYLNKYYIPRESDQTKHMQFAAGDKLLLNDPNLPNIPTPTQLETGKLVSVKTNTETDYSFKETSSYNMFEAALKKFGGLPLLDNDVQDFTPPKIDLSVAEANRQATAEHDAALYPYAWPHSDEF